ncbi:variable surface lipoprotein [Mycoplasmopsis canis]|uniref:variable surface lipoprotein n=1 Tax=Mycoplasmopsis cynos TaxID=171284 RepID=UPI002AFE46BD|nr:variable surface lipoprotein [Mycoplasmopsis cynos]WQQ13132.1 variable surface lipoprotein [Mycoplasmopsis cynos]WQQ14295.1 variable surface lipoprotein [Mycoplasmopsis cynos]
MKRKLFLFGTIGSLIATPLVAIACAKTDNNSTPTPEMNTDDESKYTKELTFSVINKKADNATIELNVKKESSLDTSKKIILLVKVTYQYKDGTNDKVQNITTFGVPVEIKSEKRKAKIHFGISFDAEQKEHTTQYSIVALIPSENMPNNAQEIINKVKDAYHLTTENSNFQSFE